MQPRATAVSQGSVCRSQKRQDKQSPADKGGWRARLAPSPCGAGAYDFLNTTFEDKPLVCIENDGKPLRMRKVYNTFRKKCELFFSDTDITVPDYGQGSLTLRMASLATWFEDIVQNMGFFAEVKDYGNNLAYMNVMCHSSHLCDSVIVFYAKPLDKLPEEAAQLYREFLAYLFKYMNVSMGTGAHCDVPQIEYLSDWFVEMADDEADEKRRVQVVKDYSKEGRYEAEFDRIAAMEVCPDVLRHKLMTYDSEDEISKVLISHLYEGFDLIPQMNLQLWGYDETEELAEEDEYFEGFGCIVPHMTSIFWDEDGVPGSLRMDVENNYNGGLYVGEWIRHIALKEDTTQEEIECFKQSGEAARKFRCWYDQYEMIFNEFYG